MSRKQKLFDLETWAPRLAAQEEPGQAGTDHDYLPLPARLWGPTRVWASSQFCHLSASGPGMFGIKEGHRGTPVRAVSTRFGPRRIEYAGEEEDRIDRTDHEDHESGRSRVPELRVPARRIKAEVWKRLQTPCRRCMPIKSSAPGEIANEIPPWKA